ncbi:MAG: diphosphomevalonate decarboxylase [Candidatus Thermoplasmatota archaeon]|jgi:mevalonate-3-kinase|nr:diphosphomevalonate decarboxylase [Candidatus Thermoplasmatota archaeon]
MEDKIFRSSAHPTMGIVLLGGLKDNVSRHPYHDSAGIAYSLVDKDSVAKTELTISRDHRDSFINNEKVDINGSRSPLRVIERYRKQISEKYGMDNISVNSWNENIISGSSDAGAAALQRCINDALPEISSDQMEIEMRKVSESVGRSFYGGLTVTENHERPITTRILEHESFSGFTIISAVFPHTRKPSDDIHFNQPKSPAYPERISKANSRIMELRSLAEEKNIEGIFELAMKDTDDYHALNERVGVEIITDEMRVLLRSIGKWREEIWMTYIVTGGNSVFIPCHREDSEEIRNLVSNHTAKMYELKVAGPATSGF